MIIPLSLFFQSALFLLDNQIKSGVIKFKLSAINLPSKDLTGLNDPYVQVFSKDSTHPYEKIGETSVNFGTLNPDWNNVFEFNYQKGIQQRLKFLVKDWDIGWNQDDFLGRVELNADDIVTQIRKNGNGNLRNNKPISYTLSEPEGGSLILYPMIE